MGKLELVLTIIGICFVSLGAATITYANPNFFGGTIMMSVVVTIFVATILSALTYQEYNYRKNAAKIREKYELLKVYIDKSILDKFDETLIRTDDCRCSCVVKLIEVYIDNNKESNIHKRG